MAHNTSRLALNVVDGSDAVSNYPTANAQAMGVLDNAAIILSGTLVSRPAASIQGRYYLATDDTSSGSSIGTLYFDTGAAWVSGFNPPSRGATNIATSESRTNTVYGTLPTADQVTGIVLPTNGLLAVGYQATWQESVTAAARAAIFVGSNQIKMATAASAPVTEAAATNAAAANTNQPLASFPLGLGSGNFGSYSGDVTTGQVVGIDSLQYDSGGSVRGAANGVSGGPCYIFAAAGTYTVSVQFKASSGSVTASNRKLWVQALAFS